jgi:hypothetical protein
VELNRASLADLVGRTVLGPDGTPLGRVFDVRARRVQGGGLELASLLVGRRALWRRLAGDGRSRASEIPWSAVRDLPEDDPIIRLG